MFKTKISRTRKLTGLFLAVTAMMAIVSGTVVQAINCPDGGHVEYINTATGDAVFIIDQFPAPNNNTYGTNSVGWGTRTHTFNDLASSDKAGFQIKNGSTVVLSFNIDYISAKPGSPSCYGSLGPFGGDGSIVTGTLTQSDIVYSTSLDRNLNNLGYFANCAQVAGDTNLLQNSPATGNHVDNYTLANPAAWPGQYSNVEVLLPGYPGTLHVPATSRGWEFRDTYFVTVRAVKMLALGAIEQVNGEWRLKSGWSLSPNGVLHNSPANTCPPPGTPTPTPTPTPGMTPTPTVTPPGMTCTPTPTPFMTPTPTPPSVPEPISIILFGTGLASLGFAARRKLRKKTDEGDEA